MASAVTTSAVTPGLSVSRRAPAAIHWLVAVLGFRVIERHDEPDGAVGARAPCAGIPARSS